MRHLRHNRALIVSLIFLLPFALAALLPGVLAPHDPNQTLTAPFQTPSSSYPLGTDELGRDLLSRIIFAARADMGISLAATLIALIVGATVGLVAGYLGGFFDQLAMRVTDVMLSFPSILLALFLISVFGRNSAVEILSLAVLYVPGLLRLSRGLALSMRSRGYVEASIVAGAGTNHVTRVHLLPGAAGPLLVGTALVASATLLAAATLSYFGLGTQPPDPSWGNMLQDSFDALFIAPWYGVVPGLCITLVALGYTWLGDGIEHAIGGSGRAGRRVRIATATSAAGTGTPLTGWSPPAQTNKEI
jgi:peptide/nickel transport system permease protein